MVPTKLKKQEFQGRKLGYMVKIMLLYRSSVKSELSSEKSTEHPSLRKYI